MRKIVRGRIERHARETGQAAVTLELVEEVVGRSRQDIGRGT